MTDLIQQLEKQIAEKDLQILKLKNLINDTINSMNHRSKSAQEYLDLVRRLTDSY